MNVKENKLLFGGHRTVRPIREAHLGFVATGANAFAIELVILTRLNRIVTQVDGTTGATPMNNAKVGGADSTLGAAFCLASSSTLMSRAKVGGADSTFGATFCLASSSTLMSNAKVGGTLS